MKKNTAYWIAFSFCILAHLSCQQEEKTSLSQPNILWITSEDMNAFLGAYGDELAVTPNLDRLASEGVLYRNAFATAPVCSPSRSCIITGLYATTLGTQHLRSEIAVPEVVKGFPKYLREAGYYCTNNGKEDYNFVDPEIWDESSGKAHWRNREEGRPFFSVFNIETTHQSKIFGSDSLFYERFGKHIAESVRHEPEAMNVPPYHFDSPEVRKLWTRYYDLVTLMDQQAGEILKELEEDGLTEETIIFYYADHGTGMPRSKRALYDSGLKVPLIIKAPQKWREALGLPAGTEKNDLVSFVDFAPTILSLAGIKIPDHMQGIAFLGEQKTKQSFVFGHSDRVDEAYEIARTVRGERYRYIRNYLPQLPLIQDNFYTDQSEIMQELRRIRALGDLTPAQAAMWQERRPPEEFYDTQNDPYEVNNLADSPEHRERLLEMRAAQKQWALRTFDSGLLHESDMHDIAVGSTIYEAIRQADQFPLAEILDITDQMLTQDVDVASLKALLKDERPPIRYWAAMSSHIQGWTDPSISAALSGLLQDPVASVRLTAAQALCSRGDCADALPVVLQALQSSNKMSRLLAARTFEELIHQADPIVEEVEALTAENCPQEDWNQYYELYTCWALEEAFKKTD